MESLMNQDIAKNEYEVIIIDDGSTDNSRELVETYSEKHNNIILYSQKNIGAYSTRNKLLKLAKGKYIYCVDADDYLAYNSLSGLLNIAFVNNLDILGFETLITYRDDELMSDYSLVRSMDVNITSGSTFLLENPKHRAEVWWYIFRRGYLEDRKLDFDKNEHNADVVFTLRLFIDADNVAYLPISVHRYFQSSNSIMRNSNKGKNILLAENMQMMVLDFSAFINELELRNIPLNYTLIKNLNKQRDRFLFFNLLKMIRLGCGAGVLQKNLEKLEDLDAYPIKNRIGPDCFSLTYNFLNRLINRKFVLLSLARIYYMGQNLKS